MWTVVLSKQAAKDAKKVSASDLKPKVQKLIAVLQSDPYTLPYEKLVGDMQGYYSRRINIQHRLVYQIFDEQKVIKILRMWSHYE
ncbi:Txe/YoeB family addiction module toxin [Acaryochloris sp. 'Moss Beach']|uniref:Txe/YoeB family addiction module toxin n=1 Tax=Acaryochloris sp. 'Moss Beach' TaxID=2740837 RepID=UPI001F2404D3|nr:Txe/YoeB family addiction module toxin [Acaryochloris sp. 'Moss Beach']UJB68112.1 Txe/YoeB family addiction module toxin [Acaryochloris sp. 'Moss Beach']